MKSQPRARAFSMLSIALSVALMTVAAWPQSMFRKVNDFDGDGRADYVVTGSEAGLKVWHIWRTTAGYLRIQWGLADDWNASADYDGDGRYDIAVARGTGFSQLTYWVLRSQTNTPVMYGIISPLAFFAGAQDYDGDGKADPAITWTQGSTSIRYRSSMTGQLTGPNLPNEALSQRIGDLNGDGRAEAVSYERIKPPFGNRLWIRDLTSSQPNYMDWGINDDEIVAADLDGDLRGEIVAVRGGDWYWRYSSNGSFGYLQWGQNGDIPVPADYDGDGRTDIAVYRPGSPNGIYYINGSTTGPFAFVWGTPAHTPIGY